MYKAPLTVFVCVWVFISGFIDKWKPLCPSQAQYCPLLTNWELHPNEEAEEQAPVHNYYSSCCNCTAHVTSKMLCCSLETGCLLKDIIVTTLLVDFNFFNGIINQWKMVLVDIGIGCIFLSVFFFKSFFFNWNYIFHVWLSHWLCKIQLSLWMLDRDKVWPFDPTECLTLTVK